MIAWTTTSSANCDKGDRGANCWAWLAESFDAIAIQGYGLSGGDSYTYMDR